MKIRARDGEEVEVAPLIGARNTTNRWVEVEEEVPAASDAAREDVFKSGLCTKSASPTPTRRVGEASGTSGSSFHDSLHSQRTPRALLLRLAASAFVNDQESNETSASEEKSGGVSSSTHSSTHRRGFPFRVCVYGCASSFRDLCVYEAVAVACRVPVSVLLTSSSNLHSKKTQSGFFKSAAKIDAAVSGEGGSAAGVASKARWIVRLNDFVSHIFCPAIAACVDCEARWSVLEQHVSSTVLTASSLYFAEHRDCLARRKEGGCFYVFIFEEPEELSPETQRRLALLLLRLQRQVVTGTSLCHFRRSSASRNAPLRGVGWILLVRRHSRLDKLFVSLSAGVRFPLPSIAELSVLASSTVQTAQVTSPCSGEAEERRVLASTIPAGYLEGLASLSGGDPLALTSLAFRAATLNFPPFEVLHSDVSLLKRAISRTAVSEGHAETEQEEEEENRVEESRVSFSKEGSSPAELLLPFGLKFLPWKTERLGGVKGHLPRLARALARSDFSPKTFQALRGMWIDAIGNEHSGVISRLETLLLPLHALLCAEKPSDEVFSRKLVYLLADFALGIRRMHPSLGLTASLDALSIDIMKLFARNSAAGGGATEETESADLLSSVGNINLEVDEHQGDKLEEAATAFPSLPTKGEESSLESTLIRENANSRDF